MSGLLSFSNTFWDDPTGTVDLFTKTEFSGKNFAIKLTAESTIEVSVVPSSCWGVGTQRKTTLHSETAS